MINELVKLANHLDQKGLMKEADYLDSIIQKYSMPYNSAAIRALRKVFEGLTGHTESANVGKQVADAFGGGHGHVAPRGGRAQRIDLHGIEVEFFGSKMGLAPGGVFNFRALQQNNDLKNPKYDVLFKGKKPDMSDIRIKESKEVKEAIMAELYSKLVKMTDIGYFEKKDINAIARANPLDIAITIIQVSVEEGGELKIHNHTRPNPTRGSNRKPVYQDPFDR